MDQGKTFETKGSFGVSQNIIFVVNILVAGSSSWAFKSGIQERGACSITVANI